MRKKRTCNHWYASMGCWIWSLFAYDWFCFSFLQDWAHYTLFCSNGRQIICRRERELKCGSYNQCFWLFFRMCSWRFSLYVSFKLFAYLCYYAFKQWYAPNIWFVVYVLNGERTIGNGEHFIIYTYIDNILPGKSSTGSLHPRTVQHEQPGPFYPDNVDRICNWNIVRTLQLGDITEGDLYRPSATAKVTWTKILRVLLQRDLNILNVIRTLSSNRTQFEFPHEMKP